LSIAECNKLLFSTVNTTSIDLL